MGPLLYNPGDTAVSRSFILGYSESAVNIPLSEYGHASAAAAKRAGTTGTCPPLLLGATVLWTATRTVYVSPALFGSRLS